MVEKRKIKQLFCSTTDGMTTYIRCRINEKTGHVDFPVFFHKSSDTGYKNNKKCAQFLGIYIAERILSNVYLNVKKMKYANPGYDFICGNGFKIDVKSCCLSKNEKQSWTFSIDKNTTADYFLCLSFDNRINLNPQHLWLIPGKIINNKMGATISESTLSKWSDYEITDRLHDVMICCDTLRK